MRSSYRRPVDETNETGVGAVSSSSDSAPSFPAAIRGVSFHARFTSCPMCVRSRISRNFFPDAAGSAEYTRNRNARHGYGRAPPESIRGPAWPRCSSLAYWAGKTTHAELIADRLHMQHVNVGDLIREKRFYSGWDEEFQAYEIDEQSEDAVRRIPCKNAQLSGFATSTRTRRI